MNYQLEFPGRVIFGPGTLGSVFEHLPPSRVLVVAGSHCADAFRTAFPDKKFELITGVRAEPTLDDVERVRRAAARYGATAIIGIGGGSVLDTAKATAALLDETRPTADFFYGAATAKPRCVFLALLPTTAGTGAEITGNAVLTDEKTGVKQSLRTLGMRADVALIDPELTYDCPASIAAASGFDALTQAIESFLSRRANAASSPLAAEAVRKIFPALRAAVRGDRAARNHVAEGSMLAALAFAQSGLGAVHGIAHPAGAVWHIPHGVCCAILLPLVLRYNQAADATKLEYLGRELAFNGATEWIAELELLRADLGLPAGFARAPKCADVDFIVKNCRSGSMKCNPRDLADDEVRTIVEELCRTGI